MCDGGGGASGSGHCRAISFCFSVGHREEDLDFDFVVMERTKTKTNLFNQPENTILLIFRNFQLSTFVVFRRTEIKQEGKHHLTSEEIKIQLQKYLSTKYGAETQQ